MFEGSIENLKRNKVVPLFVHPSFESTLYPEDEIIEDKPKSRYEIYAKKLITLWQEKGLRQPRRNRKRIADEEAIGELVAVMKGQHPRIHQKLTYEEIKTSINNLTDATFDLRFSPTNKDTLKRLDIPRFIYTSRIDCSYLLRYLKPPRTLIEERNPKLTEELIRHYQMEKWGDPSKEVSAADRYAFVLAANAILSYLSSVNDKLQPLMHLSYKNPYRAAYGMIQCAKKSKNWNDFNPRWLSNSFSIAALSNWLKDQGFFKFTKPALAS